MPPTWLVVVLVVAILVVAWALRDFEAERAERQTVMGLDNEGHFRTMTFEEANRERRAAGDVPLAPYTWETWAHDKREDAGLVLALLSGNFGH